LLCGLDPLDYLLALNQMAGRHWGNRAFHAVVPWVIDMACAVEGTLNDETADSDEEDTPPGCGPACLNFKHPFQTPVEF
jgi:hypothetical protein